MVHHCMSQTNLSDFLGVACDEENLTSFIHIHLGFCVEVGGSCLALVVDRFLASQLDVNS